MSIRHVDLVHFGSPATTGSPTIRRFAGNSKKRYIDIAVDASLATMRGPEENKFCWTAEAAIAVRDWWLDASPERRTTSFCRPSIRANSTSRRCH